MKKKIFLFTFILAFFLIIFCISKIIDFVYINPLVNTKVLPHIAKTIKPLNKILNIAIKECQKDYPDMHFVFQNAYGSGFLQGNGIPNDLDYSVGVYLGKFQYDETNANEIAANIADKIGKFETSVYSYIESYPEYGFYPEISTLNYISKHISQKDKTKNNIIQSFDEIFQNKDYVVYHKKQISSENTVNFPFVLKPNEILLEDASPITLYTNSIKYNNSSKDFLRELTIVVDYSFDIENTKTGQNKNIELVAEAFLGQRLQVIRRLFIPTVFIGKYSENYIKTLDGLNNEEKYIQNRLYDFGRYIQLIKNLQAMNDNPIKMLKRYLQCTDIIYPVLASNTRNNIYDTIEQSLNNEYLSAINDYSTILSNLFKIFNSPKLFGKIIQTNEINKMTSIMDNSINLLYKNNFINDDDYKKLSEFNKNIKISINNIKSQKELNDYAKWFLNYRTKEITPIEVKIAQNIIQNQDKLTEFINEYEKIYKNAGYHNIELYWLEEGKLGVLKDEYTNKIPSKELKQLALENNLADVEYVFVSKNDIDNLRVRYSVWVRYKPTVEEQKNYEKLKNILIKDKTNLSIKHQLVF